jgi:hypothetical protein|uniref:Uncharacterized protein n=1 Tax=Mimiviridae sp. ChoanoV1 TaxID=2596887 RepID=A0A5B8IGT5_9VIRU|nr:hypothetical protein 1_10 [Mimiviridae sp. ChoanoV1]
MLKLLIYIAILFGIIYGIFKFFLYISNALLLIDENFINYIKNSKDVTVQKIIDKTDFDENKKEVKKLNRHLRLDFFISLIYGIIWFFCPRMILNISKEHRLKKDSIYIGKTLGLFTLISSIFPLINITNEEQDKKEKILIGKLMVATLVLFSFIIILYKTNYLSFGNVISIIMTSFWLANGFYGVIF